ncbi:MAG: ABC transporter substrate-binding protein [Terriglobales bacterium]
MRIGSLLASATEILYAIGAGDEVVAVSEKCDFPAEARGKPVIVRSRIDGRLPQRVIDEQVNQAVRRGESLYEVDAAALARLGCDLLVTQDVCHVCAASPQDLGCILGALAPPPALLALNPHRLADVWDDIRRLGAATAREAQAEALAAALDARTRAPGCAPAHRPRVLCLEWFDPPFIGGHWVPEMVALAGGEDVLGVPGGPGFSAAWDRILETRPEAIVLMPCGYHLEGVVEQYAQFRPPPGWDDLPAVRAGRVFAVDASGHFSRHGPRLAEGVESLRQIVAACAAPPPHPSRAVARRRGAAWTRLGAALPA